MKTTYFKKVDSYELPPGATAVVYLIAIQIDDVRGYAQELITVLNDTSWIDKLNPVGRLSFEKTAKRTINKLVVEFQTINNTVTSSFGEYMVSMSAGQSLGVLLGHLVFPISELWKEKLTNNHGFDFHTQSPQQKLNFGEAKYNKTKNPYTEAAGQVVDFIEAGKDGNDAALISHLASPEAIENLLQTSRGFSVAFSINSLNPEAVLLNALASDFILELCCKCDELQLIGVSS
jgi:hypothetical protein